MKIIKLNAIDSTNSFLKELAKDSSVENFTVVTANIQTKGRGQQMNNWVSEPHKNLTMSMFVDDLNLLINHQKYLNFAISLAVYDTISFYKIEALKIKWPNDIMSVNKKICGILIENTIRKQTILSSIIGIGLNVNQVDFPDFLQNVSSLKLIKKVDFSLDDLLENLVKQIKKRLTLLSEKQYHQLEKEYLFLLYKKNIPSMFKNVEGVLFMGKIIGISSAGNLQVELEDERIKEFGIKEISLA